MTITIPDSIKDRVETAYSTVYGYQKEIEGIVKRHETDEARVTTETTIDTDLAGIE